MSSSSVSPGATLVIGSLERGAEYQALIGRLEADQAAAGSSAARLDRYLVDRIVDGGTTRTSRGRKRLTPSVSFQLTSS